MVWFIPREGEVTRGDVGGTEVNRYVRNIYNKRGREGERERGGEGERERERERESHNIILNKLSPLQYNMYALTLNSPLIIKFRNL